MTSGGARPRLQLAVAAIALLVFVASFLVPMISATAAPGPPPPSSDREVLKAVHTDALHVTYEDGQLGLGAREGLGEFRFLDPAGLVFNLEDLPAAQFTVPDIPAFAFLGEPGRQAWLAPETQEPSIIWPGWDTETLSTGMFAGDAVDLTLVGAEGPGDVEVFFNFDPFAGTVRRAFSSTDEAFRTFHQQVGSHVHANWVFTALGTYRLTFEAKATTVDGQQLSSGPVDYTFVIGPYTPAPVATTTELAVSPEIGNVGDEVTLTGTVAPADATGWIELFDGDESLGHEPVTGGQAVLATNALAAGEHSLTARFTPSYNDDWASSTSTPVLFTVRGGEPDPDPTTPSPDPTTPSPDPTTPAPDPTQTAEPCDGLDVVLDDGHVDVAARLVDGQLQTRVKDGTKGPNDVVWRPLEKTGFHAKPESKTVVPEGEAFAFLGAAGDPLWQLPQTQQAGLLWPGWNTEEVDYTELDGPVRWSLDAVEGPGMVAVFEYDPFGQPIVVFDSGNALPQRLDLASPTHAHGNWAFTKEGVYRLTFTYRATTTAGATLTDTGTLPIAVGAVDLAELCPGGAVPDPSPTATPTGSSTPTPSPSPTSDPDDGSPPPTQVTTPTSGTKAKGVNCVAAAPTPTPTSSPTSGADRTVLDDGHVDYAVRVVNGKLTSQVKDGTVAGRTTWRDPSTVVLHLKPAAKSQVPTGSAFSFLGSTGAPIWQIPQTQRAGILWLGWNTEELTSAQVNGSVTWKLDKVEGPGKAVVFEFDSFGQPKVVFDSGNGVPDTFAVPLGTHAHGNWAFTKEGTYELTFTHSAKLAGGTTSSDTAVVRFAVDDIDLDTSSTTAAQTSTTTTSTTTTSAMSNGCILAKTGSDLGVPLAAGSALLGVGALLTGFAAYRRRKTNA